MIAKKKATPAAAAPAPVAPQPTPTHKPEPPKDLYAFVQEANRAYAERGLDTRYEVVRGGNGLELWKVAVQRLEKVDIDTIRHRAKKL